MTAAVSVSEGNGKVKREVQQPLAIRAFRRGDAEATADMMASLAAYHGDKSLVSAKHFVAYCLGAQPLSKVWVAFVGKKPVGFAIAFDWMNFVRGKPVRTLDLLYVEEGFRKLGIGQALVAALAEDALKKGFLRFDASAQKGNRPANAFYKSLGFEKRALQPNRYMIENKALIKLAKKKKT